MSSTPAPVTLKPDVRLPLLVVGLGLVLLGLVVMRGWPDRGAHLQKAAG